VQTSFNSLKVGERADVDYYPNGVAIRIEALG
jgi:hypothetical protein